MKQSVWPAAAPYAVCPTHDVDRIHKYAYHYLVYSTRGINAAARQLRTIRERFTGKDPFWNFEKLMEFEARLGIRSTFLFLNESATGFDPKYWGRYAITDARVRRIIKNLDSGGWEVGLHGSYFSFNDLALLKKEKETLEDLLGKPVVSTRQHYLNLAAGQTWELQQALGLKVDSTVGYSRRIWDAEDGVLPYYPKGSTLLELPITVMDTVGLGNAAVFAAAMKAIEKIKTAGGLVVLDWHQCAFNEHENPERVDAYTAVLQNAKQEGAWIATMAEIAEHWRTRGDRVDDGKRTES